jgi:hypothetical protein
MNMKNVTTLQREWLVWLLTQPVGRIWLNEHIQADGNIFKLHRVTIDREYDTSTRELLNFILGEFKKDSLIKDMWMHYNGK